MRIWCRRHDNQEWFLLAEGANAAQLLVGELPLQEGIEYVIRIERT